MTLNGSGIRDIARVLHSSPTTVLKSKNKSHSFNTSISQSLASGIHVDHH